MINPDDLAAALEWIGQIDNASGQVCQLDKDGKPVMILFEFGCPACSEVGGKNAEEYGNALVLIVEAARAYLTTRNDLAAYQQIVSDSLDSVQRELEAGGVFSNVMLSVAARIALAWLDRERGQR